jgi:nitroreductase
LVWAVKSTALACENYMLTARALGYDTCPMEGFDSARVTEILNLPCDAHIVMVISLGKRAPNGVYGPQIRFDIKDFVKEH